MFRIFAVLAIFVCQTLGASAQNPAGPITAKSGMVVCVSPPAAEVGVEILKKGGTAVDAAVAVAFAEAVTHPQAGNIGGGGFMLVYPGDSREPVFFDYRERAPLKIAADTLAQEKDMLNHRAVGVPGTVRGMELAHKKFGKLPWKDLLLPAVKLAEEGFLIEKSLASALNSYVASSKSFAGFQKYFAKPDGTKWQEKDRLVQKDLAITLNAIATQGAEGFYAGKVAELIVAEMARGKGLITLEDLKAYEAKERQPLHSSYRGYDIIGSPPVSSGGTAIIEMLNILENYDLKKMGRWSPEANHLIIESMRRAFRDRAEFLGDPDFNTINPELIAKSYGKKLAGQIDLSKATPSLSLAGNIDVQKESKQTTHFSIVDASGMAVSNTYTLEETFGSRIVVDGAGFLLNNEMGDFNTKPGVTNTYGRIGTKPNLIQPGKRMLSSMSPTIVAQNGHAVLVTGSPGGRTIINTTLNVILNVIDFDMDVQAAVNAPRSHQQWLPDTVSFERSSNPEFLSMIESLKKMGHTIKWENSQGDAHSIWIDPKSGLRYAGVDKRIEGRGAGY